MNYSKKSLMSMDPVEVYKLRLDDKIKSYPKGFFLNETGIKKDVCQKVIRYLIEERLHIKEKEIPERVDKYTFLDNKLRVLLVYTGFSNPYNIINIAYPNKFHIWQFGRVSNGYWNKKTGTEAVKWLIEEKLKWDDKEVCKKLSHKVFKENGLGPMLDKVFNGSVYEAINTIYPNKFKPWQLVSVPKKYWDESTLIEAVKWLIEEKLKWSDEEVCQKLSHKVFKDNGLGGMLMIYFNNSMYKALDNAYPGKFITSGRRVKLVN